jgi:hypothetical protein
MDVKLMKATEPVGYKHSQQETLVYGLNSSSVTTRRIREKTASPWIASSEIFVAAEQNR